MKRVAIIPARGGSKRLPRKNILPVLGLPMIAYPLKSAFDSGLFDKVIVSTEDEEIACISKDLGAQVEIRPQELATDQATIHQVIRHVLLDLNIGDRSPDYFCIIYSTAIFLEPCHLIESEKLLSIKNVDGVLAVQTCRPHPHKALINRNDRLEPAFPEKFETKGQYLQSMVFPAGAFHWMKSTAFLDAFGAIWKLRRIGYCLKPYEAIDIDDPEDLELAERLLIARQTIDDRN